MKKRSLRGGTIISYAFLVYSAIVSKPDLEQSVKNGSLVLAWIYLYLLK